MLIKLRHFISSIIKLHRPTITTCNAFRTSDLLCQRGIPNKDYGTQCRCSNVHYIKQEEVIMVENWNINYLKVGTGPHTLLLIPGALGTVWTDFKPQIESFDRDKFTLVVWEPPGYGKSRPPDRDFPPSLYERDARSAHEFMKALEVPRYSVLGWSDGGSVAMLHAAKYPAAVDKLVVWATNSYILPEELALYRKTRDLKSWSEKMKKPMVDFYGEEVFAKYWALWLDGMHAVFEGNKGDICAHLLKDIVAPTFILYGEKDPIVAREHIYCLNSNIKNSRIHLYPEGKHNIHLRYPDDFNKRVQEFLLEASSDHEIC